MIHDVSEWRLVHYEADILSRVPWDEIEVTALAGLNLSDSGRGDIELRAGLDSDPLMEHPTIGQSALPAGEEPAIDYLFAASHLLDVIPNPWRGREVAQRAFGALLENHSPKQVLGNYTFIL